MSDQTSGPNQEGDQSVGAFTGATTPPGAAPPPQPAHVAQPEQYAVAPQQQYADPTANYAPASDPSAPAVPRSVMAEQPVLVPERKTFVIRGVLWGVLLGLGLAIVSVVTKVIPLDLRQMIVVLVVGIVAGTAWSLFGPAKKPRTAS